MNTENMVEEMIASFKEGVEINIDKWEKTTLRRGTKRPRICRDMFITDSRGRFVFCHMKNGSISTKVEISSGDACHLICKHKLVKSKSVFTSCFTYRDFSSSKLIRDLLRGAS